eukprot:953044-Lingulodinium_polyedra.AAC.1
MAEEHMDPTLALASNMHMKGTGLGREASTVESHGHHSSTLAFSEEGGACPTTRSNLRVATCTATTSKVGEA